MNRSFYTKISSFFGNHKLFSGYLLFWSSYFFLFWKKALYYNEAGDLLAGHVNIWGDWAAHFTIASRLGEAGPWLSSSPFLINAKFSYPYAADLISAGLYFVGLSLNASLVWPSFIFSILVALSVWFFFSSIFKKNSWATLGSSTIFLLNGGWGWSYRFAQYLANDQKFLAQLFNPNLEATRIDELGIKWINIIDSMIIPQRAFTLGFPIALVAITIILNSLWTPTTTKLMDYFQSFLQFLNLKKENSKNILPLVFAGMLLGILPFFHMHSFLAAAIILAGWSSSWIILQLYLSPKTHSTTFTKVLNQLSKKIQPWLLVLFPTLLIAVPLYTWLYTNHVDSFIQFDPGWLAPEYKLDWFLFWWRNWGLTLPVALIGIYKLGKVKNYSLLSVLLPFWVLFALANIFRFQPFMWDNTKLIVWTSLGISASAWLGIEHIWHQAQKVNFVFKPLVRIIAVTSFGLIIISGSMDAYRNLRHDLHSYVMYSNEELELATWTKANTPADSIWLTGENHNHWLFNRTGRQTLMAYRGWLWTHGYEYRSIENDIRRMYANPKNNSHLFKKYNLNYVVVGKNEKDVWLANEDEFESIFTTIHQSENYQIFLVN